MLKATVEEIKELAQDYSIDRQSWHFHILTPTCQLNETDRYALVLENATTNQTHICYSDEPYMGVGKELVQLLHGSDVVKESSEEKISEPSEQVAKLLQRASELNRAGKSWHHHMLFPNCQFNNNPGAWAIIFEDKEKNELIEAYSTDEPKKDLQHIETLFYKQKKAA